MTGGTVRIEVGAGELIDRLTILAIKSERIADPARLRNVQAERAALEAARTASIPPGEALAALEAELRSVNERLWDVEDALRDHERRGDFGAEFVELARSVYRTNDRRAALKRAVDDLLGSRWREEKSYAPY